MPEPLIKKRPAAAQAVKEAELEKIVDGWVEEEEVMEPPTRKRGRPRKYAAAEHASALVCVGAAPLVATDVFAITLRRPRPIAALAATESAAMKTCGASSVRSRQRARRAR